jgi:hypothetical protein
MYDWDGRRNIMMALLGVQARIKWYLQRPEEVTEIVKLVCFWLLIGLKSNKK